MVRRMRDYTFRATSYFSVSLALLILSLALHSEFFLIASLFGFSLLLLSLAFNTGAPVIKRSVSSSRLLEGETIDVELDVSVKGNAGALEVFERLSPMLEIAKGSNKGMLPPGRSTMSMSLKAPLRGYHQIGPTIIRRWDPLFLWFSQDTTDDVHELSVLPQIYPGKRGAMELKRLKERPGAMHLRRIGMGKEFHSIRDYTPTDPFNTINWKAYARTGKLLVNQYEAETVTDVILFIDSRNVSRAGPIRDNPLERSIRFCASMSSVLIGASNRVGLIVYGSTVKVLKPNGGQRAFDDIMHTLTAISSGGFNNLLSTVEYALPYLPPEMPVIILSSLAEDPTVKEGIKALITRGHPLTVVSPSGIDFERALYEGEVPMYLLRALERRNLIKDLRSMGAKVIDWKPERDVGWAIEEVWA
ncbi:MAG: DUF58 domain-containing protein [Candidatus Thermoplasmatota archaeon]|nr:DUF58 domain-containing protein [Candidatus Thermoplasmatota archaeon]